MKYLLQSLFMLVAVVILGSAGCSRPPKVAEIKNGAKPDRPTNVFQRVLDGFRYPDNPRGSDDWTRFRDGIRQLDNHFAQAEILDRIGKSAAGQRKFLESELGLSAAELSEIEATSFRTADAHYLDECFLLKEAAQSLDVRDLPAADQANLYFQWVMRNILPHEQGDSNTPPGFTLRRGFGSSMERAMVFLALLRQAQIEGCVVVVPDSVPLQFLVGVHDAKASSLRLFDTRLGLPVLNKNKGIATFHEALADPSLLEPSKITPEQVKKLEPWIVCPIYALAPRLFELQRGFSPFVSLTLHLNAGDLHKEIAKAAGMPVKAWKVDIEFASPGSEEHKAVNSPARWLRAFLPKEEGGSDETKRAAIFYQSRLPFPSVMANYTQINMTELLLPAPVFRSLQNLTKLVFDKYELQTREMLLRSRHDALSRRHERIQVFVRHESLLGLLRDETFAKERGEWQEKLNTDFANLVADPKMQAQAQQVAAIWTQDVFIRFLLDVENEKQLDHADRTSVMTKILAVGMRDYFDGELPRVRAMANHEKAAHAQAILTASAKQPAAAKERAREAWEIAAGSWGNLYLDRISLFGLIDQHHKSVRERRKSATVNEELHTQVSLLEKVHLDVHKYFQARLRLAECRAALEGPNSARIYLEQSRTEIDALEKKGILKADVQSFSDRLRASQNAQAIFQPRLDLLARDWTPTGSYFWLKKELDARLNRLPKN